MRTISFDEFVAIIDSADTIILRPDVGEEVVANYYGRETETVDDDESEVYAIGAPGYDDITIRPHELIEVSAGKLKVADFIGEVIPLRKFA